MKKQVELSITHNGKDVVAYPYTKKEHVQFENGMNIDEFVGQDIATPTITHDTTAIKVGVGDSDVSSSVVDSAVNMTIKGQTYQNILPDPTLRNEMQGKSMQRLNEGYDSIETVDGVSKSAILKGQTLVNLCPDSVYTNQGWSEGTYREFNNFPLLIKGKKYTIYAPIGDKTGNAGDAMVNLYVKNGESKTGIYNTFGNGHDTIHKTFIMGDVLQFRNFSITGERFKQNYPNVMIIEGEWGLHEMPNYFKGITSCKMPVLQTIGKNLVVGKFKVGTVNWNIPTFPWFNNGELGKVNRAYLDTILNLINGKTYTLSCANPNYAIALHARELGTANKSDSGWLINKPYTFKANNNFSYAVYVRKTNDSIIETQEELVEMENSIMLEEGSTSTTYESYKTNILRTPEEVVLKGLGDVQDTLNVNTGEYVQRIGEITLDKDGKITLYSGQIGENTLAFRFSNLNCDPKWAGTGTKPNLLCNMFPTTTYNSCLASGFEDKEGICLDTQNGESTTAIVIRILKSRLVSEDVAGMRDFISKTKLSIASEITSPTIRTVDLSSHGNWEKVVLDGDENWRHESSFAHNNLIEFKLTIGNGNIVSVISDHFATGGNDVERIACTAHGIYIRILKSKVSNLDEFKIWVQQNPTTVWYQTTTTQDNSIREMLSFANGHLQVSSEAENSLLPTVQYEIPTKNSYHMDLMKANTVYTMKLASGNGSINKWDGEAIGFMLSRTFNSGTLPKDNLFYTTGWVNDLMILEGDLNAKTIPYFKGIKSAFEGEDKIEVLSTGKNLFDWTSISSLIEGNKYKSNFTNSSSVEPFYVKKGEKYVIVCKGNVNTTGDYSTIYFGGEDLRYLNDQNGASKALTTGINWYGFKDNVERRVLVTASKDCLVTNIMIHGSGLTHIYSIDYIGVFKANTKEEVEYEPYKSNTTKIPLLSPLRSLPNGICDELIIDRLNHKAKLIQRVGELVVNGEEKWVGYNDPQPKVTQGFFVEFKNLEISDGLPIHDTANSNLYCNTLSCVGRGAIHDRNVKGIGICANSADNHFSLRICLPHEDMIEYGFHAPITTHDRTIKGWLRKNPTTVLYELATPIITEVDLEGFPYIYKDGHIFLNSDIAPTTEITYSINQAQQIESANENLQRHEKEITHLQKLIAQYIQVEYESTLLSLKI